MKNLKELTEYLKTIDLAELEKEDKDWSELLKAYQSRSFELGRLKEKRNKESKANRLNELLKKTNYLKPEYPAMGVAGDDGVCSLTNEEEAKELISMLVSKSYYYAHDLKWSGPGTYIITTDYGYDHDREVIYTATYTKEDL